MKTTFRAIYWLAAVGLLLMGVAGLARAIAAFSWHDLVEGELLSLIIGAMLLPPVIERVWAGGFVIGHGLYWLLGALYIVVCLMTLGALVQGWPQTVTLVTPDAVAGWLRWALVGLLLFPCCTKRIKKDLVESSL